MSWFNIWPVRGLDSQFGLWPGPRLASGPDQRLTEAPAIVVLWSFCGAPGILWDSPSTRIALSQFLGYRVSMGLYVFALGLSVTVQSIADENRFQAMQPCVMVEFAAHEFEPRLWTGCITMEMLRMTFPVVGPHLLKLINASIVRCELPRAWKVAAVVPLHKKGDRNDPNNYRPISVLPVVSKLCERIVCTQLMYLSDHHLLCPQQYGFRPGLSTEAALLDAVTYAVNNIDRGLVTSLVTADTSKAFDSVEHGRLLDKLGWYGIDQRWFAAWLSGRKQAVTGATEAMDVTHGVIQGSILGPILFTIFTSDLPQHVPDCKLVSYADDCQFFDAASPSETQTLKCRVENTLATTLTWFTQNRLKINPSKTVMLIIKSRRQTANTDFSVSFGDDEIFPSDSVKILGITVDPHLSWDGHVGIIVRRCNVVLIGIARLRHKLPKCTRQLLVQALVFPHIRYCLTVWGNCSASLKARIQKSY